MQSGITVCRTAIAHAALLALCGAAHAQQATPTAPTAPTAPAAEKALAPVTVSAGAEQESPTAPVTGFVAKRALSATKTDTPLIETPQAISVITRDQMEAQGVQTLRQVTAYTAGAVSNYFDSRVDSFAARGGTVSQYQDGLLRTYGTTTPADLTPTRWSAWSFCVAPLPLGRRGPRQRHAGGPCGRQPRGVCAIAHQRHHHPGGYPGRRHGGLRRGRLARGLQRGEPDRQGAHHPMPGTRGLLLRTGAHLHADLDVPVLGPGYRRRLAIPQGIVKGSSPRQKLPCTACRAHMAAVALAQRHTGASPRGACTTCATVQGAHRDSKGCQAPSGVGFWRALPEPCCAATTFG